MNTQLSQKNISSTYPTKVLLTVLEILLLTLIGAVGVVLHAKFRFPLRLPGHWGIVFMALLFSGRFFSKKPYASSLSSIGAVAMLMLPLGFKDPFMPILYILPGFIVDVFYHVFSTKNHRVVLVALLSGLAYMTIPIVRLFISMSTGILYGSFVTGFLYPLMMHFVFGAAGGLVALGLYKLIKRKH